MALIASTQSEMAKDPYLVCQSLTKRFDGVVVLNGVNLSLACGEVVALLGPSGCGKTTLLNIVQGILPPDIGTVHCDDQVLDDPVTKVHLPMRSRRFATVFQDFSLWPHMTIGDNVGYGLKVLRINRAERKQRVKEALSLVGMQDFESRYPATLSGGQQQRVAIARAIVVRPRVLLLDEPLSALDVRLREELRDDLALLLRRLHITALYVTHDQSEAFALADRVAVMHQGVIEQIDTPSAIYKQPSTGFVAGFLGSANVWPFAQHNGHLVLGSNDASESLPIKLTSLEQGVCRVLREHVQVQTHTVGLLQPNQILLAGTCEHARFLGDRYELLLKTQGGLMLRALAEQPVDHSSQVHATICYEDLQWLAS